LGKEDGVTRRTGLIVAGAVVISVVIWLAATAMAQDNGSSGGKPSRTITVTSTATVKAAPDEAVVDLGVRSESADSADAFAQNATAMQAALDALRSAGIAEEDMQTTNISLEQRTENRGKPDEQRVFVASNSVHVTIVDLTAVGSVIDAAVAAGADSVNDIRFQLANPHEVRTDALHQAVTGARTKADALAEAAGASVVAVVTVDEQNFQEPVYRAAFDQAALAASVPTPIVPPSSLQVSETVKVVWEIA
jgi:uncharacterized protein YggE